MERRRASSANVNALQVDGGPGNPRHADCRANWCRRSFWKQGPVCGLRTVVEHAAGIDGEPEEGTGQAGPPSGSSSFCRDGVDISLRAFHDFAALQPGLEPCEIE